MRCACVALKQEQQFHRVCRECDIHVCFVWCLCAVCVVCRECRIFAGCVYGTDTRKTAVAVASACIAYV